MGCEGQTCRTVAERFGLSVASVVKWSQRFRATGNRRPAAVRAKGERHGVTRVSETPDLTFLALAAELAQRGMTVSHYAVWHSCAAGSITFEESLRASEQNRPIARRRPQALPRPA